MSSSSKIAKPGHSECTAEQTLFADFLDAKSISDIMIELLSKIETILATAPDPQGNDELLLVENTENVHSHPLTSWTGDRITDQLHARLPQPQGAREQEVLQAFQSKKYSRCKIYLQLIEDTTYVQAIISLIEIPKAIEEKSPSLPSLFNDCVRKILKVHDRRIADSEGRSITYSKNDKDAAIASFEKLAIDVFAKGLGDESDQ